MSIMSYLASAKMHKDSAETIFHAPMSFFDTIVSASYFDMRSGLTNGEYSL